MAAQFPATELSYEEAHINDTHIPAIYAVTITFYVIAVITVFARLLARSALKHNYALEDYLIVATLITSIPFTAATISAARYGVGRQVITLTPHDIVQGAKWNIVNVFSYGASMTLVKLSILALYDRLFGSVRPKLRVVFIVLAVYAILWVLGLYLGLGLQCQPFSSYWTLPDICSTSKTYAYAGASLDAFHDILVFAAPQVVIWRLQMNKKRRLGIAIILSIGFTATIMGIVKAIFSGGPPHSAHPLDASYEGATALIVNALEVYLSMICACLPAMPGFVIWARTEGFTSIRSRFRSAMSSGTNGSRSPRNRSKRLPSETTIPADDISAVDRKIHVQTNYSVSTSSKQQNGDVEMQPVSSTSRAL